MNFIYDLLAKPVGYLLRGLSYIVNGNFAASVFLLTLIINLAMVPLTLKSQKSTAKQAMLKPKLDALKKKYGGDNMTQQDKLNYQQAMQELYKKENVSLSGGCLPLLIRLPFFVAIYSVIQAPLTYLLGLGDKVAGFASSLGLATTDKALEHTIIANAAKIGDAELMEKVGSVNFDFFGINLTGKPEFSLNFGAVEDFSLWIIPFLAFATAMLTSIVSMMIQKKTSPDTPNSMAGMMLTMPLISLFIAFGVPCAVGFYWACSNLISGGLQAIIQLLYGPNTLVASERGKNVLKRINEENLRKSKVSGREKQE